MFQKMNFDTFMSAHYSRELSLIQGAIGFHCYVLCTLHNWYSILSSKPLERFKKYTIWI